MEIIGNVVVVVYQVEKEVIMGEGKIQRLQWR